MKINSPYFIAFDIGSSKIASLVAQLNKESLDLICQDLKHSEGIRSGNVINIRLAENSLIEAIYSLEKIFGKNIRQITISLSGSNTKSFFINQKVKISSNQVTKSDIKKLVNKAIDEFKYENMEIINCFPIEFSLDNSEEITNPVGLYGKELECRFHIIAANSNLIANLTNCFAKHQVEVVGIVLGIHASGIACLTDEERQLGTMIVDMGAQTTAFGIFFSGELVYTGNIPIGGAHITSDIAKGFGISLHSAEKLKVLHGNAILSTLDKSSLINIEDLENEISFHRNHNIDAVSLTEIINARTEEIIYLLKSEYDKVGIDHLLSNKLVLTGGGATLRGVKELTSIIFEKRIRLSRPQNLPKFVDNFTPNIYSTLIGMALMHNSKEQLYMPSTSEKQFNWLLKIYQWFKENI